MSATTQPQSPRELAPILRWVGSKRALAGIIGPKILEALAAGGRYFEPFLGSAAIYLWLWAQGWRGRAVLSDACVPLMGLYRAIQRGGEVVKTIALEAASIDQDAQHHRAPEEIYGAIRELFNAHLPGRPGYRVACPYQAARFIYLNRRCFNGLWRQGPRGEFNVAWGGERKTPMPTIEELQTFSEAIQGVETLLYEGDFEAALYGASAGAGDVIYCDSPYNGSYAGYSARFGPKEQERLAGVLKLAHQRGAAVFTSNADTPYIRALYSSWATEIEPIPIVYRVGGKGERRQTTNEVLISARPR